MRSRDQANRAYAGGTAVVIAVLLSLSLGVFLLRPPTLDPATLCPTSRPIAGHTLVIVDRTDKWNPAVGDALKELIETAQKDTKQYEKFSIVSMDAGLSTRPLFSVCNPGAPSLASDLYRGRRYTKVDFDQKFIGASDKIVAELGKPSEAQTSPIVEFVHRWLGNDDFNATIPNRKVILISDMRQNSQQFDVYTARDRTGLAPIVQREFGPAAKGVVFDIYFVAHGHDYNVSENDIHTAWDNAFHQIAVTYDWRQIN